MKYKDYDEFQARVDDFFATCDKTARPYTITGLAMHLGTSRMGLKNIVDRGDYDERFIESVLVAKQRCELWLEESLLSKGTNVIGAIFSLKNNFGWKDKTETEYSIGGDTAKLLEERRRKVIDSRKLIELRAEEAVLVEALDE